MQPPSVSNHQTQSAMGLLGSLLVFACVVSAPAWLRSQEDATVVLRARQQAIAGDARTISPDITAAEKVADVATAEGDMGHPGASHYQQFCASCHGQPGAERVPGLVGSDLFDGVSERPFTRDGILLTLQQGILEKGMLPMQALLSQSQMEELVGYLIDNQQG